MKRWLLSIQPTVLICFASILLMVAMAADELKPKPEPTIESLKAEVQNLKAELAKQRNNFVFEMGLCNAAVQSAREQFVRMLGSPVGADSNPEVRGNGPRQLPGSNPAANPIRPIQPEKEKQ